jgi:hypothetical protein
MRRDKKEQMEKILVGSGYFSTFLSESMVENISLMLGRIRALFLECVETKTKRFKIFA